MSVLACFVLLAATTSVELVDVVFRIPPADWKYVEVNLRQKPALVSATYEVVSSSGRGPESVRLALMTRADLARLRDGVPHGLLAGTPAGGTGALDFRVRGPGDYVLVVAASRTKPARRFMGPDGCAARIQWAP